MSPDPFKQIPEECLIANNNPAYADIKHDSFLFGPSTLRPNSGLEMVMNPEMISNSINVLSANSFADLNLDGSKIEKEYKTIEAFKELIIIGISNSLLCVDCPLRNTVCDPELYFDGLNRVIKIIPSPLGFDESDEFEDGINTIVKKPGYFDLPLAS
jgi:hypothetical protein